MPNNDNMTLTSKPSSPKFIPKTLLGKKLAALRAEIIASGEPLLDIECVEREIAERRGGVDDKLP